MAAKPIPDGYHAVTPYLLAADAARLIEFLKAAFDARETHRMAGPDGRVMHAEVRIGDSTIMTGQAGGPRPVVNCMLYHYVTDADSVYRRAIQAGGVSIQEPADQFYGDRVAAVRDPEGNQWWIATHKEDLSEEEMQRRAASARK